MSDVPTAVLKHYFGVRQPLAWSPPPRSLWQTVLREFIFPLSDTFGLASTAGELSFGQSLQPAEVAAFGLLSHAFKSVRETLKTGVKLELFNLDEYAKEALCYPEFSAWARAANGHPVNHIYFFAGTELVAHTNHVDGLVYFENLTQAKYELLVSISPSLTIDLRRSENPSAAYTLQR